MFSPFLWMDSNNKEQTTLNSESWLILAFLLLYPFTVCRVSFLVPGEAFISCQLWCMIKGLLSTKRTPGTTWQCLWYLCICVFVCTPCLCLSMCAFIYFRMIRCPFSTKWKSGTTWQKAFHLDGGLANTTMLFLEMWEYSLSLIKSFRDPNDRETVYSNVLDLI